MKNIFIFIALSLVACLRSNEKTESLEGLNLLERVHILNLTNLGTEEKPLYYFNDALFTGIAFENYYSGQLLFERSYKDGKLDGLAQVWWENGRLQGTAEWKDGKQDGLTQIWWENGFIRAKTNWKDGEQNGLSQAWSKDGQLMYELMWKDGVQKD